MYLVRARRIPPGWGDLVKGLREARGWSQTELAGRAGIGQSFVSKIEQGGHDPSGSTLLALAEALNVSVDVLLGRAPPTVSTRAVRLAAFAEALLNAEEAACRQQEQAAGVGPGLSPSGTLNTETVNLGATSAA